MTPATTERKTATSSSRRATGLGTSTVNRGGRDTTFVKLEPLLKTAATRVGAAQAPTTSAKSSQEKRITLIGRMRAGLGKLRTLSFFRRKKEEVPTTYRDLLKEFQESKKNEKKTADVKKTSIAATQKMLTVPQRLERYALQLIRKEGVRCYILPEAQKRYNPASGISLGAFEQEEAKLVARSVFSFIHSEHKPELTKAIQQKLDQLKENKPSSDLVYGRFLIRKVLLEGKLLPKSITYMKKRRAEIAAEKK